MGRVWQQQVDAGRYTWSEAAAYCAKLALTGGGWRLPTIDELEVLVGLAPQKTYTCAGGAICLQDDGASISKTVFPNTPATTFWSSTQSAGSTSTAWVEEFVGIGGAQQNVSVATKHAVRCVR